MEYIQTKAQKIMQIINEIDNNTLDLKYFINETDLDDINNIDDLQDYLKLLNQDRDVTNTEIIGYYNAMQYLLENDYSLKDSIDIAYEYGYTTNEIHSELLASLLATRIKEDKFYKMIDDIINQVETEKIYE